MNENIDKLVSFSRDVLSDKIKIDSQELSDKLAEVVRFHEWRYYTLNEPILSDTEYDFLFKALEAIESAHPEWRSDHSPTQRVGLEITENAKQIDHLQPMLSLANSYNEKDLVYFDYDSFVIKPEFQALIADHARYIKAQSGRKVAIEGHTDETGGREYNLALGQKRADAVRNALGILGVPQGQMEAVSFGKEKPAVAGTTDEAYAKNRRTEIRYP